MKVCFKECGEKTAENTKRCQICGRVLKKTGLKAFILVALFLYVIITSITSIRVLAQEFSKERLKWCAIGDSWTEENSTAKNNYVKLVEDKLCIEGINLGISGTGFKRGEESNKAYYQRVEDIPLDIDLVTIMASGNDLGKDYVIGEARDKGTTTICGCINTLIDNIYSKFTGIKIGIMSTGPWQGNTPEDETKFKIYVERIEEICKLRGIPFLNIFTQSNLRPNDLEFRIKFMPDGVHPNDNGYELFSNRIIEFIKGL